jgi:hypothetical protein
MITNTEVSFETMKTAEVPSNIATDILVEDLSLPTINDNGVKIIDGAA